MQNLPLPPMIWPALATVLIAAASQALGADQVGTVLMTALSVVSALLKAWQVQQPGDADSVATRGMGEEPSKMRKFWLK